MCISKQSYDIAVRMILKKKTSKPCYYPLKWLVTSWDPGCCDTRGAGPWGTVSSLAGPHRGHLSLICWMRPQR